MIPTIRAGWEKYRGWILAAGIAFMVIAAVTRLSTQEWILLFGPGRLAGVDLLSRHRDVHLWFDGMVVYNKTSGAGYPPASYAMLFPVLGWVDAITARWIWGGLNLVLLAGMSFLLVRSSGAESTIDRGFIALVPFSIYPTPVTIGIGQYGNLVIPALATGILLLDPRRAASWRRDAMSAALILIGLIKINIAIPFVLLALWLPGRWRPILLIAAGYVTLTLIALSFQPDPAWKIFRDYAVYSSQRLATFGTNHLPAWLGALGLGKWNIPASVIVLIGLGFWIQRHRNADIWLLLGVTGIVARIWAYHHFYDDSLIVLPMIALYRIAKSAGGADARGWIAGGLFAVTWFGMQAPGALHLYPSPWNLLYYIGEPLVWIADLIFLAGCATREVNSVRLCGAMLSSPLPSDA